MLVIHGESLMGKTELAKSWFKNPLTLKVGGLVHTFPSAMRSFDRKGHDGVVLDDVRDLEFIAQHQHVFQANFRKLWNFRTRKI